MTRARFILAFAACGFGPSTAALAADASPVAAFDKAYATSLYVFDACGDGVAGEEFRRALADKFDRCGFGHDAAVAYAHRTALTKHKVHETMTRLMEERGGEPMRLEGMDTTCHAHQETAAYQEMRARLDAFAQGKVDADAVIPARCDAAEIAP